MRAILDACEIKLTFTLERLEDGEVRAVICDELGTSGSVVQEDLRTAIGKIAATTPACLMANVPVDWVET